MTVFCRRNESANQIDQKEVHQLNQNHTSNLEYALGFLKGASEIKGHRNMKVGVCKKGNAFSSVTLKKVEKNDRSMTEWR